MTQRPFTGFPLALVATGLTLLSAAQAAEYPIGRPQRAHGMEVGAVYLQPVIMEPAGPNADAPADIHLEADVMALDNNPNGFAPGAWIPYLTVDYSVRKDGGDALVSGTLQPMIANDGPHYGANVALDGPGRYHLEFTLHPPADQGHPFRRHVDRETGVDDWFSPVTLTYDFVYAGIGKKGGY